MNEKGLRETKWVFLVLGVSILVVVLLGYLFLLRNNKPQDLELYSQTINLGEISENEKRDFKVSIRNPNRFSIDIVRISTSCGCTKASIEDKYDSIKLMPMAIKIIEVRIDESMHKKGDIIDHEVYILAGKPLSKEYKIKVAGKVI